MEEIIKAIQESIDTKKSMLSGDYVVTINRIAEAIVEAYRNGCKVIVFGNGGSASDAQHMAGELVGRFLKERRPLPAISLTTNTSILTAIANDYSYDVTFKRQLEALAAPGDVAIGISTSGNAVNVLEAVDAAKKLGLKTIAITGKNGGKLAGKTDIALVVPSANTPSIQEAHIMVIHIICGLVENRID